MKYKIVVITSHYLYKPTSDALGRISPDCEYIVVPYDSFDHLVAVYERYAAQADGFLISGRSALHAIQMNAKGPLKTMVPFQADTAALYKELLHIVLDNREQDLRRVVMDALLPVEQGCTAADFLEISDFDSLGKHITDWVRSVGERGTVSVEDEITKRLIPLWGNGEIDMVIAQYTSVIPVLEKYGIPYRYPFLSDQQLGECVRELLVKIELEKLRSGLPAAICVSPRHPTAVSDREMQQLQDALQSFFRKHLIRCAVQCEHGGFRADVTVRNVRYFTHNSTTCMLSEYLAGALDFEAAVGYGVGSTAEQAGGNALAAMKEAAFHGKSFVRDESGNLVGPLDSDTQMVVSIRPVGDVGEIARQCGLSTMTIQKLMTTIRMTGTNMTTTGELSRQFGVTVRNAHRILSNLEKGGFAKIVYSQTSSTKGRPVKVYELNFEQK